LPAHSLRASPQFATKYSGLGRNIKAKSKYQFAEVIEQLGGFYLEINCEVVEVEGEKGDQYKKHAPVNVFPESPPE
jgi:hypothetical protein